jgi:hypothetical protein
MRLEQPSIKRQAISLEQITATFDEFDRVVQDMFAHAGEFMPTANWVTLDPGAPAHAVLPRSRGRHMVSSRLPLLGLDKSCQLDRRARQRPPSLACSLHSVFHDEFDPLGL